MALGQRYLEKKGPQWTMFIISLIFLSLQFIVPATLEPGTITNLDARANAIDHTDLWDDLPPVHRAVYWFGDLNCHQISNRSWYVNGNEMPMCTRDIGVFIGVSMGLLLVFFAIPSTEILETSLSIIPRKVRKPLDKKLGSKGTAVVLFLLCLTPLIIDGFVQLLTGYESTNIRRVATGIPAGIFFGAAIGSVMVTMAFFQQTYGRYLASLPPPPSE